MRRFIKCHQLILVQASYSLAKQLLSIRLGYLKNKQVESINFLLLFQISLESIPANLSITGLTQTDNHPFKLHTERPQAGFEPRTQHQLSPPPPLHHVTYALQITVDL